MRIEWSKFFELNESNIKTEAQEKAGVYRIVEPSGNGNIWPFYVGQADNLYARLLQHISDAEQNPCIKKTVRENKCQFRFAYVPRAEDRNSIERALYDHFKNPRCNANVPPGTACDVNFD